jgi:hypothetical protein
MRVKLIGVSDKTRKSESVNRAKYGLLFGDQRQSPHHGREVSALNLPGHLEDLSRSRRFAAASRANRMRCITSTSRNLVRPAIGIGFHFFLR